MLPQPMHSRSISTWYRKLCRAILINQKRLLMKTALTITSALLLLVSCRSVQTMVDKGQYDQAIDFAARKLHGQDSPKTQHVKGLEEAYAKVMQRDIDEIELLKLRNSPQSWAAVYRLYNTMRARQQRIEAFLPLVSKDGYLAVFKKYDLAQSITQARTQATAMYYDQGVALLDLKDKASARQAWASFNIVQSFSPTYRDVQELVRQAHYLGTNRVAVAFDNLSNDYIPASAYRRLSSLDLAALSTDWTEYTYYDPQYAPDIKVVIEFDRIQVSPGTIERDRWTEERVVERSREKVQHISRRDSLSNVSVRLTYDTLSARVRSVRYIREAEILARMVYIDYASRSVLNEVPVTALARYDERTINFRGDRRALSKGTRAGISNDPTIRLPEADDMIALVGDLMKVELSEAIRSERFN